AFERQELEEQIDEEGLPASHRAPKIKPADAALRLAQKYTFPQCRAVGGGELGRDAIERRECSALRRIVVPAPFRNALGVERSARARARQRCCQPWIAASLGGRFARTPFLIAPRKSMRRRWKKWPVSGIRVSAGGSGWPSTQANTAAGSTTSSASPWITSHGHKGEASEAKSQRPTGGATEII